MKPPLLELEGLEHGFETAGGRLRILKGLNLRLEAGESLAIMGPSGSGKSTLLGLMAGLERPSAGRLLFQGEPIQDWTQERLAAWRRVSVGFIFQNFRLIESLNALENVSLTLELTGLSPGAARGEAEAALAALGLENRGAHFPYQLSGGEQQRVAIARAYVRRPALLFADEPTGSLDRETAEKVLKDLLSFHAGKSTALILVTHDAAVAARLNRRLTLADGVLG